MTFESDGRTLHETAKLYQLQLRIGIGADQLLVNGFRFGDD